MGKLRQLIIPQPTASREILDISKWRSGLFAFDGPTCFFLQPFDEAQAQSDGASVGGILGWLPAAHPAGSRHVDRPHLDAVPLRVLDQRRGMVEAHRPGVEQPEIEGGRVVRLEVGAGVGDEREARRVRLGEAVEREGGDRLDDLLLRLAGDAVARSSRRAELLDIACIRSTERLEPMARRSSSASPPVNPAATMAIRRSCSWKSGTPSVRSRIGSRRRVRVLDRLAPVPPVEDRGGPCCPRSARDG